MNPDVEIEYPKSQYKKYIKDVVSGTLERIDLIEETVIKHLNEDIDLKKTDKLLNEKSINYKCKLLQENLQKVVFIC